MRDRGSEITREQATILYTQAPSPITTSLAVGFFLAFILWDVTDHFAIVTTFTIVIVISVGRLILTMAYRRNPPSDDRQSYWLRLFIAGTFLQGSVWGSCIIFLAPQGSTVHQLIITLWIIGLTGGAVAVYSVSSRAVLSFVVPAMLPVVIYYFIHPDAIHLFVAISLLAYTIVLLSSMFQINRAIIKGITLNIDLATEVKERAESEARYARLFNSLAEGVMYHLDGVVIDVNPSFLRIFGYDEDEKSLIVGKASVDLLMEESKGSAQNLLNHAEVNPKMTAGPFELVIKTKSGEPLTVEGLVKPDPHDRQKVRLVSIRDITDRKRMEARLIEISLKDALTGLSNRRHFDEVLAAEWNRAMRDSEPLSLIMIDIDYFKAFNDSYGHQAGDGCLIRVGDCIKHGVKRPGDLVARYGGEELVVVLPNSESETAQIMAEEMRQRVVTLKIDHVGSEVEKYLTISLGVATIIPERDSHLGELIKKADKALYEAKGNGRNNVVISQ